VEMTTNRSRRKFLAYLTALGASSLVGSRVDLAGDWFPGADEHNAVRLHELRADDFAKHVGQTFAVHASERRLEAELAKVVRRPLGSSATARRQPFSVIFRLAGAESVPHQIYTIEHAAMGRFSLFLGAVGQPSESRVRLEAVFA